MALGCRRVSGVKNPDPLLWNLVSKPNYMMNFDYEIWVLWELRFVKTRKSPVNTCPVPPLYPDWVNLRLWPGKPGQRIL